MLAKLENALRNGKVLAYSKRLFEEFQTFIWKGNKPQAQKGYHDDMIMALAIALQMYEMSDASVNNPYESIENAMAMLKGLSRESTTLDSNTGKKNTQVIVANTDNVGPIAGEFHKMMEAIKKNKEEQRKIEMEKAKRKFYGPFNWLMDD
jgi:hypothetical protein